MGGANDHPTPLRFRYNLKLYILGRHSADALSNGNNTKGDETATDLTSAHDIEEEFNVGTDDNDSVSSGITFRKGKFKILFFSESTIETNYLFL